MQNYAYTARDDYGKVVHGTIMAEDEIELANRISKLGYYLVRAKTVSVEARATAKLPKMYPRDVLNFTIYLTTMLNAGVPLVEALRDLTRDAEKENIQRIIDNILFRVESGSTLKDALSWHTHTFSKLYLAVVGAGESTGKLTNCLNDLAGLLDWQLELQSKIKEAATYPIVLFCVMIGVVVLLVVKVIPTFEPIFKQAGAALPLPTQIVLAVSQVFQKFWYLLLLIIILLVIGYKLWSSTARGRYIVDSAKLKIPILGGLLRKIEMSRFCHTFALGLKSGVNVLASLELAKEVVNNVILGHSIAKARDSVNVGEKISTALQVSGEFPPLVLRMIAVGEQSGALSETLGKVNQFYDREVPAAIRKIFVMVEPIMIVVMGGVVGGIALSVFLPLFQMASLMGG